MIKEFIQIALLFLFISFIFFILFKFIINLLLSILIEWIAINDEPTEVNIKTMSQLMTVKLVSTLFVVSNEEIAKRIIQIREED